jgi:hypothetical protein
MTLVEVMVTLSIFIVLAMLTLMAVREVVAQWTVGERRRVLYEKAAGVIDLMADDIKQSVTLEEPSATTPVEVRARMIGDIDTVTGLQRLMFVRSYEGGPERAITSAAGDGRVNDMNYTPDKEEGVKAPPTKSPSPDTEDFTGQKVGDFKALGGMAMIGYFVAIDPQTHERTLYRAVHAPAVGPLTTMMTPATAQVVASDILYIGFDYWSQNTDSWKEQPLNSKIKGPEKLWDSTRGIRQLNKFSLYRGPESLDDPTDDVFPQMIKVIATVDSTMPRCVHTTLLDDIGERDGEIGVESTRGFPDGGDDDSYILIDDEWMHYSKKTEQSFLIDKRAQRSTHAVGHNAKSNIRVGHTFRRIIYIPNWRSNFMSNEEYYARRAAQQAANQNLTNIPGGKGNGNGNNNNPNRRRLDE